MSSIEDRLRDAMTARAQTVQDNDRPLPQPRTRHAGKAGAVKIAAITLAVTATAVGVVRLAAPSSEVSEENVVAMTMTNMAYSGTPEVAVFFCKDNDPFPSCANGKITEVEREDLLRMLQARPEVETVTFEGQQQAWENFRRQSADNPELVRAVTPGDMPESFRARIRTGADSSAVARAASGLPGVSNSVDSACLSAGGRGKDCSFMGKGR
ncbi:permease-like cell division protein FtsX [Microtetraspora malaysiensis]|uniref:Permease-like cell division protein FtsX n=1 Tax=Microtetraspora malaysiensis TaxID=161358 RepID=A0ABW6T248_9ACTN